MHQNKITHGSIVIDVNKNEIYRVVVNLHAYVNVPNGGVFLEVKAHTSGCREVYVRKVEDLILYNPYVHR